MSSSERPSSRRAFLKSSAAAAVAGALTSPLGLPAAFAGAEPRRPLRVGLISVASYGRAGQPRTQGSTHGTAFASICNGFDEARRAAFTGTFIAAKKRSEGVQVVRIWDPVRSAAENLAALCRIPTVCDQPEQCADDVDAVLIGDDGSGEQWRYATAPLRKRVPTFCAKPLALTAKEAKAIAAVARQAGTPFMSASALRFVPDIVALAREAPQLGELRVATVTGSNDLVYDGIHGLSVAYAVLGRGAISCLNVGQPGRNLVRVRYADGRDVMLIVGDREVMRAGYQITLFGTKGWRTVTPGLTDLYTYMLDAFFDFVRTGRETVPIEEEVELIAALEAGKRSLLEKREVTIAEVLM
ncbi:MAG: Gfo/Idh/MocA family oxidoreductase [Opitutaceae bacterium]|nr:Gfo/Idh/MocA family oxidoreductase [Opitutaceae bacterium]